MLLSPAAEAQLGLGISTQKGQSPFSPRGQIQTGLGWRRAAKGKQWSRVKMQRGESRGIKTCNFLFK